MIHLIFALAECRSKLGKSQRCAIDRFIFIFIHRTGGKNKQDNKKKTTKNLSTKPFS